MTNSGGDQTRPAKSRSTAPRMDQPVGQTEMDAMRQHQVQEGIKRNKPTVGFAEEMMERFKTAMGGMKHGR